MLTQIRHFQKGVLIAVTAIIVVSFALLYSDYDFVQGTLGRQDCVVKVYDRCYRLKEAKKLASHFDVALQLGLYDFALSLFGERRQDRDTTEFMMSLVILRHEAERLGIEPSPDEIKAAIPKLPILQQPNVDAKVIENNILGPNGFTQGDLAQLVKDYLCYQRLRDLVSAGIQAVPAEAKRRYTQENQRYTATVVRFDRSEHLAATKITDEAIKKYYEENKDTLLSEEKRGFDYVKFTAKKLPDDASNEAKAKANFAFANAVNRAYADLSANGADFKAVAATYAGEKAEFTAAVGVLEPFARNAPPELLKDQAEALEGLFSGSFQSGRTSVPVETAEGTYLVFHFNRPVAPAPLTIEEATPAIREALLGIESNRAVNDAASAALAKLNEAVKGGKTFAEAAKALGLKTETVTAFSSNEPPSGIADAGVLLAAVKDLGEKETSGVLERPAAAGYLVAHVDKIEIYKDEQAEAKRSALLARIDNQTQRSLFTAWFNQRRKESGARRPDAPSPLVSEQ